MRKITIKDVAKHAGVSTAAVSYVLNGKEHKVSADTIEKIQNAVKLLNYIPNFTARSLVQNRSKLIGVMIPQTERHQPLLLENPFYSEIVSGIERVAREKGYHILLAGVDSGKTFMDVSVQRNLDGAVIMGIYPEQFYADSKQINIPIVLIDSYIHDQSFSKVGIDDEYGGYLATRHLIEKGHRNIALVTGTIRKDGVVERRFLGYKRALEEAEIFYNPDYVFEKTVSYDYGYETGRWIATQYPEITALFATADTMALGAIRGLKECGKEVPADVSVVGFDNIPLSEMFLPQLTTVHQGIAHKGQSAASLLFEIIDSEDPSSFEPKKIVLPITLVERQTVRSIAEKGVVGFR